MILCVNFRLLLALLAMLFFVPPTQAAEEAPSSEIAWSFELALGLPFQRFGHQDLLSLAAELRELRRQDRSERARYQEFVEGPLRNEFAVRYLDALVRERQVEAIGLLVDLSSREDFFSVATRDFVRMAAGAQVAQGIRGDTADYNLRVRLDGLRTMLEDSWVSIDGDRWARLALARNEFSFPVLRAAIVGFTPNHSLRGLQADLTTRGQERLLLEAADLELKQEMASIRSAHPIRSGWLLRIFTRLLMSEVPELEALGRVVFSDWVREGEAGRLEHSFQDDLRQMLARRDVGPNQRAVLLRMAQAWGIVDQAAMDEGFEQIRTAWFQPRRGGRNRRWSPLLARYMYRGLGDSLSSDRALICQTKLL